MILSKKQLLDFFIKIRCFGILRVADFFYVLEIHHSAKFRIEYNVTHEMHAGLAKPFTFRQQVGYFLYLYIGVF